MSQQAHIPAKHIEIIARGLLLHGGSVLLCRNIVGNYRYLPGGHIEPGESAREALARELHEEAGLRATVGPLLLVTEERFEQGGRPRHEINLVFHVEQATAPDATLLLDGDGEPPAVASLEGDIAFDWIELASVHEAEVKPSSAAAWLATGGSVAGAGAVAPFIEG